jgi:Ca2+:H+ antiporter
MLRGERALLWGVASAGLFLLYGAHWRANLGDPLWFTGMSCWLLGAILVTARGAVRHAEVLAGRLGEPYGTLIQTMAVTSIEITMIANIILTGGSNPGFPRDTMFAVLMIVLNGLVGLALLLGALRFHEQQYNLQGANSYLVVIIPLAGFGLIVPDFTTTTSADGSFSGFQEAFLVAMSVALYLAFLLIQTIRHQNYFTLDESDAMQLAAATTPHSPPMHGTAAHVLLLIGYLVSVVLLAEQIAYPIDYSIEVLGAPMAAGGFLVAALILAPEAITGIRAAMQNNLQRAVNILLGSALATISLTIPAVLVVGYLHHRHLILGLPNAESILLAVTLLVCMTTFSSARTNVLQGAVHVVLFFAYVMLIFQP